MPTAYLVDGLRTPFGRHGGALASVRADDLAAHVLAAIVERTGVPGEAIDDVVLGCANQAGEDNRNIGRQAALLAGLPLEVPGVTVNRLCGSGMQAFSDAARLVLAGDANLVLAGGVEQMSRAPWVMAKPTKAYPWGPPQVEDTTLGWRFVNPKMREHYGTLAMGETAERVAEQCKISREAQDAFALASQRRAAAAIEAGTLHDEIIPIVTGHDRSSGDEIVFSVDEHPRPDTTPDQLAKLKPAFARNGTVTAGNASGINDGACAMLVASERAVRDHGLVPLARYVAFGVAGVEPSTMGLGPIPASRKALARAGLAPDMIDLAEVNEAFAAQAIPCIGQIGLDPARVNVNGGAIALGHPLGASGARLVITLAHELRRRAGRYGLASMCIGVGQGIAVVLERVA
jgi:3-oxoadipyl-CoA thiolase